MILVKEEIRIVCYLVWFSGHEIAISNCKKVSGILNMRDRCNTKYFTAAITIWRLDTRNVNASEIRNYLCPHFQRLVIVTWEDCQLDTRMEFKMGHSRLYCIFWTLLSNPLNQLRFPPIQPQSFWKGTPFAFFLLHTSLGPSDKLLFSFFWV